MIFYFYNIGFKKILMLFKIKLKPFLSILLYFLLSLQFIQINSVIYLFLFINDFSI